MYRGVSCLVGTLVGTLVGGLLNMGVYELMHRRGEKLNVEATQAAMQPVYIH